MDELILELSSPKYWISVVLVSFLVNIIASYSKRVLDNSFSKISIKYSERLKAEKNLEIELIKSLLSSKEQRSIYRQEAILERVRSVWHVSLSAGMFVISLLLDVIGDSSLDAASTLFLLLGTLALLMSMKFISSSNKKWGLSIAASNTNKSAKS